MDNRNWGVWFLVVIMMAVGVSLDAVAGEGWVTLTWDHCDPRPWRYELYQRAEGTTYNYDRPIWRGVENRYTATFDNSKIYYYMVRALRCETLSDSNEVIHPTIELPEYSRGGKDAVGMAIIHGRTCRYYKKERGMTQAQVDACIKAGECRFGKNCNGK